MRPRAIDVKPLEDYMLLIKFSKPKSYERFIIQSQSCLSFDVYNDLNKIKNSTTLIALHTILLYITALQY